jgi:hypothetical protein
MRSPGRPDGVSAHGSRRAGRQMVCNELVHVSGTRRGGLPTAFDWRGRRYRIAAADQSGARWGRSAGGRMLPVRTTSGMRCVLEHRMDSDLWTISRILSSL